jgi:hypothetical protein
MDANWAIIVAAVVTAVGGIIVAVIQHARRQDSAEHGLVMDMIRLIHISQKRTENKLDKVDERLSQHLQFHASEGMLDNHGAVHQDGVDTDRRVSS